MRPVSSNLNATAAPITQHSAWHSPVPYLFGGLAAMLGLIAFALLILACSYWKLSGYLENGDSNERDVENGDEKPVDSMKIPTSYEAKVVVIMAGDEKPTYLATPISSRASSFGDNKVGEKTETQKKESENKETAESHSLSHSQTQTSQTQTQTQSHDQDQDQDQSQNV
ncbi:protein GLUTAMINE DUMPER 5 [Cinnamomum micranthum f. kanehirae]|uniref:Protein GLUTAMINE DUMPER 5 n=1 Tax=Cinnamomum micranthum f. kanehirae TaxID=337451 RepID=A0A3S3N321_9MAGN|nr:protein GLUTAMINE DUMPER 5 [Cinnamomum micranthum f. kanehirae]